MLIQSGRQLKWRETQRFHVPAASRSGILTRRVSTACQMRSRNHQRLVIEEEVATPVMLQFGATARFGGRVHNQSLCHEESPRQPWFALVEADRARAARDDRAATRAWKLFLLLPRLLLHKPPRGGQTSKPSRAET